MRIFVQFIMLFLLGCTINAQSIGMGTSRPNNSTELDSQSNSKVISIPRMTSSEKYVIASPGTGLPVSDSSTGS